MFCYKADYNFQLPLLVVVIHLMVIENVLSTKLHEYYLCSNHMKNKHSNHIYPTPPLGQDMTQGQFLSGV